MPLPLRFDPAPAPLTSPFDGIHATRVEEHFGDAYGTCACGNLSLPYSEFSMERAKRAAAAWVCDVGIAEANRARSLQLFARRVREAQINGVVR